MCLLWEIPEDETPCGASQRGQGGSVHAVKSQPIRKSSTPSWINVLEMTHLAKPFQMSDPQNYWQNGSGFLSH